MLRRLDYAGRLPPGADLARQSIPQEEIAALLQAVDHPRARVYFEHFRAEFLAPRTDTVSWLERASVLGYERTDGNHAPGVGYDSIAWSGARPLEDESKGRAGVRVGAALAPHFAAAIMTDVGAIDELQLNATAGWLGAWLGRREIGYGMGEGGGLVLNQNRLDAAGVFLTRPLRLPLLGAARFEMHVAQIENVLNLNGVQRDIEPWFWTARGSIEPFANFRIGINRGMMFGGEGNLPITFERVAENIIGIYTSEDESNFANQVISLDFRYRLPFAPLAAYLDWGSDDAAGGWWDVPAIMAGIEYAVVDSAYDVAFGAEHLQFSGTCCSNSIWYRNAWFRGSWANGENMLGHPLGGHGREWRLFANGGWGAGTMMANAAVYARRRRAENILVPAWQGKSTGVRAGAELAPGRTVRLLLDGEIEWGEGDWRTARLSAALRYGF